MKICQSCGGKIKSSNWNYCHKCGTEILNPSQAFIYEQLFELMKLQDNRRQHLDSKAHTYIGLLSIAVTIIVALGGLAIENIRIHQLLISNNISILFVLYVTTVLLFTSGVIVAFRAYHIGSPIIPADTKSDKVYLRLEEKHLIDISDKGLAQTQKTLIDDVRGLISKNQKFNIKKSNNIIRAYYITIAAIISLLLLCVTIILSIYGLTII